MFRITLNLSTAPSCTSTCNYNFATSVIIDDCIRSSRMRNSMVTFSTGNYFDHGKHEEKRTGIGTSTQPQKSGTKQSHSERVHQPYLEEPYKGKC